MCDSLKQDYNLCEELGRGRFGIVHRCYSTSSFDVFACKSIAKQSLTDETDRLCLERESKILHLLSGSPNIINLHAVYENEEYLHLVTDICDGGDLFDRLSSGQIFSESESSQIFRGLMNAVTYCHRMGVAHRDIKPDNVFFDSRGNVKLGDFGSAEFFEVGRMSGVVGTPYYVAPEVLMGREYDEKVDVWSCGVILYIMLAGVPPFYGDTVEETFEAVLRGNLRFPTKVFRGVSTQAKDLLRKMLCRDPVRRLSAERVLRHPWVMNGGETAEME